MKNHVRSLVLILFTSAVAGAQSTAPAQPTADEIAKRRLAQEEKLHNDWPDLQKYRDANAKLSAPVKNENRVVFFGNSITEGWARYFPTMFPGKPYIGRGSVALEGDAI